MSAALLIISDARAAGVGLSLDEDGQSIIWESSGDPPSGLLARLQDHKAEVIAALRAEDKSPYGTDDAQLWRNFFAGRVFIRRYNDGLSQAEAKPGALEDTISYWLERNPLSPGVPEDGCIHCAGALAEDYRVAVLAGAGHAWLHPKCVQAMNEARLALAECEVRRLLGFNQSQWPRFLRGFRWP